MKSIVLSLACLVALPMVAQEFVYDGLNYSVLDAAAKTCLVAKNPRAEGAITIPSTVQYEGTEYTVTTIGKLAFAGSDITAISIPATVMQFEGSAFDDCDRLDNANFASYENIYAADFENTYANPLSKAKNLFINGVSTPDVVIPSGAEKINQYSFPYCPGIKSVYIPASVKFVGREAFYKATGLKKVEFETIESLCTMTFVTKDSNPLYNAKNLYINGVQPTVISIPEGLDSIPQFAFYNLAEVTKVNIPSTVTRIGQAAFYQARDIVSAPIPESVTFIGVDAFAFCNALEAAEFASWESLCNMQFTSTMSNPLTSAGKLKIAGETIEKLVVPEGITAIREFTFSGYEGEDTDVVISNTVESIGKYAFYFANMESLYIPSSVKSVANYAFYGCLSLTRPNFQSIEGLCSIDFQGADLCNPVCISGNLYINGEQITTDLVIPEGVTSVGSFTFQNFSTPTNLTLPASVELISNEAFQSMENLEKITYYGEESLAQGTKRAFNNNTYKNALLCMSAKGLEAAKSAMPWKYFTNTEILSGVADIAADAAANGPVYNIQGIKVADTLDAAALAPGIYVVNGKKIRL